ncbi:MAG: hypothetical protein ACTSVI_06235 [Promethearchaeota archaeon]
MTYFQDKDWSAYKHVIIHGLRMKNGCAFMKNFSLISFISLGEK